MAGIMDFLSPEAGQRRRKALDRTTGRITGLLDYFLGPTGIPDKIASANALLNPVVGIEDSMKASREMTAPGRTPMQRVQSGAEMAGGVAGAVLPAFAGRMAGNLAGGIADALTGLSTPGPAARQIGQTVNAGIDMLPEYDPTTLGSNLGNARRGRPSDEEIARLRAEKEARKREAGLLARIGDNGGPPLEDAVPATLDDLLGPVRGDVDPLTLRYSPTRRAMEDVTLERGTWADMRQALLNQGAKSDEIAWLGLDDIFTPGSKVTRDEVAQVLSNRDDIARVERASAAQAPVLPPRATFTPTLDPAQSQARTWGERRDEIIDALRQQYIDGGDPDGPTSLDHARDLMRQDTHLRDNFVQQERDYYINDWLPDRISEDFSRIGDLDDDEIAEIIANSRENWDIELSNGRTVNVADLGMGDLYATPDPNQMVLPGIEPEVEGIRPDMQSVIDDWRDNYADQVYDHDDLLNNGDGDSMDRVFDADNYRFIDQLADHYDIDQMAADSFEDQFDDYFDDDSVLSHFGVTSEDEFYDNARAADPDDYLDDYEIDDLLAQEGYDESQHSLEDLIRELDPDEDVEITGEGFLPDPNVIEGTATDVTPGGTATPALPDRERLYPSSHRPQYGSYFTPGSSDYITTRIMPNYQRNFGMPIPTGGQRTTHNLIGGANPTGHEPLLHTRAGVFKGPGGGKVYHVGEIQSDWAQGARKNNQRMETPEETMRGGIGRDPDTGVQTIANGPYVGNNKWAEAGIRQSIADAVLNDADYVSLGTGDMAGEMTYLPDRAKQFYDKELKDRMQKAAKQLWGPDVKIETIPMTNSQGRTWQVPAIKLTKEMKEKVRRGGIPLASVAGGMGLMNMLDDRQKDTTAQPGVGLLGGI